MSVDVTALIIKVESQQIDSTANSLNKLVEAADKAEKSSGKLSASNKATGESTRSSVSQVEKLLEKYQKQVDLLGANTSQQNAYNTALRGGTADQQRIAMSLGAQADAYKRLAADQAEAIRMNRAMDSSTRTATTAMRSHNTAMQEAHALARGLSGSFGALWVTYGNLAGMAAGLAIGSSLKGIVEVGRDVESTLESIRVRGNETTESVDAMRRSVYELGQGVYGPQEVAKAFETLVLAGLKADQALSAISSTMNLAVAGSTSIEKAASTLVSVGTSIGYVAEGYNRVGDVISKTAALSMSSVETLSEAFKSASSVASLYGVTLEDIGTSLGVLSNLGIQGSAAGTALKNMYKELNSEADKVKNTMKQLKLSEMSFKDSEGNFKPLLTVIKELDVAMSKLSANEEAHAKARLSNERGLRLLVGALDQYRIKTADGSNALEDFLKKVTDSYGFMGSAAVQMSLTADNQMKMVTNSLKTGFADAFATIQPEIISVSSNLKEAFQSEGFREGLRGLAILFANMAEALANNIPVVVKLAEAFVILKAGFIIASVWQAAASGVQAFGAAVASGAASMSVLNAAMGAVAVVIGVATLAWIAYRTAQEDSNKAQKAAVDYSEGYLAGIQKEIDNLEKVNQKLREGIALKDVQRSVDADNARMKEAEMHNEAVVEARKNLATAQAAIDNSMFFKEDMEKTSKLFLAKKALAAAEEQQRLSAIASYDKMLEQNRAAKENAELVERIAKSSKAGREAPTLTLETEKKTKSLGLSGIEKDLAAIVKKEEEEKRSLISISKANDEYYRAKVMGIVDYTQQQDANLKAQQAQVEKTYKLEAAAIDASMKLKGRTQTELNELSKKSDDLDKKRIDDIAKLDDARVATSVLLTKVMQKEITDAQAASDKIVESIRNRTNEVKAQIEAYDSLPEAVRNAGVTDKQLQDEIAQAKINNIDKMIVKEQAQQLVNERTLDQLREQKKELTEQRDALTTREGQRNTNIFNLGFAARAKEESTMAIQAFNEAGKTISSGLQDVFGDAAKPVSDFFNALTTGFAKQTAAQEKFNKTQEAYKNAPEKVKELKMQEAQIALTNEQAQANMSMYAGVAGAAQQFFDKQSTGYKVMGAVSTAFHAAEVALAIASIAPKIAAGAASMFAVLGPFAWPAIGAMVATMAAFGFSGGGGGSGPSASDRQESQGTGSVLGDEKAKSDSIQKSLDIIAKDSGLGLVHFQSMDVSLKAVVAGLTGLSTSLVQFGGINTLGKQIAGNQSGGFFGSIVNSIFGGKTSVQDAGVMFGSSTVGGIAANGVNAQSYNDLKKSGGWFSSDKYSTQTKSLGDTVNNQIADVINNIAATINAAANQLGLGGDAFQNNLKSFVVDLGKISLKDMTGDEVNKALSAIFSKLGDDMAMFAVAGLEPFRKVGEGYLETLSRVANDLIQVQDVFAMFGKTLQSTGLDAIKVSEGLINAFGSVEKLTSATKTYIDDFFTDAEKLVPIQKSVVVEMNRLGKSSVTTVDQFKALVSSLDLTVAADQAMYAALMNVAPAFKQVADAATEAAKAAIDAAKAAEEEAEATKKKAEEARKAAFDDLKTAATKDFNILNKSISKAKADAQDAYTAQVAVLNAQITSLQASSTAINSLVTSLDSSLQTLLTNTVMGMSEATAKATLDQVLATAKSTGVLPTADSMKDTLAVLSKGDSSKYGSYEEYIKDTAITAGKMAELRDLSKDQGTVVDKQLQTAKDQLAFAKTSLDAELAKYDMMLEVAQQQLDAMNGNTVATKDLANALLSFMQSSNNAIGYGVATGNLTAGTPAATQDQITGLYQSLLNRAPDASGLQFYLNNANTKGTTALEIAQSILSSPEYMANRINGSHANGLDNVPFDGYTAKLHKGEMVLPSAQAKGVAQGADMAAIVEAIEKQHEDNSAENRAMKAELTTLRKLFVNLSPNGQTLQTTQTIVE